MGLTILKISELMKKSEAFSLLELLITIALVAILIMTAYPSYSSYLVKARRNLAEISLFRLASQLENFYSVHDTYEGATLENMGMPSITDDHFYQFFIQSANETSYIIQAMPLNSQLNQDQCGTLSLNELGEKISTGEDNEQCW